MLPYIGGGGGGSPKIKENVILVSGNSFRSVGRSSAVKTSFPLGNYTVLCSILPVTTILPSHLY